MIIITGIGRCGTSAMTQFLIGMGYEAGYVRYDPKIRAGMEHPYVVAANRSLYETLQQGKKPNLSRLGRWISVSSPSFFST